MLRSIIAGIKSAGKSLDSLDELLVEQLKELCDVEDQIIAALPKMVDAATTPALKRCFQQHLAETKIQKQRLEQVFRLMDMKVSSTVSDGIRGILEEGQVLMMCKGDPAVKDAAMIACAQRVEHYEMACYGSARTFAQYLGRADVAALLQQTLDEEGETDKLLTSVAISGINQAAAVR